MRRRTLLLVLPVLLAFEEENTLEGDVLLTAESLRWRDREAGAEELAHARREQLLVVGSCSFFEPVAESTELSTL